MNHRRQIVVEKAGSFSWQKIRHYQDARRDSLVAQDGAFLDVAHCQPARSRGGQRAGNFYGAVPVSVRLYDWHHFHRRTHNVADRPEVLDDLLEGDFYPGSKRE